MLHDNQQTLVGFRWPCFVECLASPLIVSPLCGASDFQQLCVDYQVLCWISQTERLRLPDGVCRLTLWSASALCRLIQMSPGACTWTSCHCLSCTPTPVSWRCGIVWNIRANTCVGNHTDICADGKRRAFPKNMKGTTAFVFPVYKACHLKTFTSTSASTTSGTVAILKSPF